MFDQTRVSFPSFGIEPFTMDKVAFTLFGKVEIRWYALFITLGIVLAFVQTIIRGKRTERVIMDDVLDVGLSTVICGIIGARLYYVLTNSGHEYHSLMDVIAIWEGGLGIYGGIIGGCLGIYLACRIKKLNWKKLFDMIAPGVILAQGIGRWGNFVNGEAYGYPIGETTTFYFFNKAYILDSGEGTLFHFFRMGLHRISSGNLIAYYHPTFLYESIWNIAGFVLLTVFYKRKKFDGQVALAFFTWYGLGRMFIEGLRTDSLYLGSTSIRVSQLVALICLIAGPALIATALILQKKRPGLIPVVDLRTPMVTEATVTEDGAEESVDRTEEAVEAPQENEQEEEQNGNQD